MENTRYYVSKLKFNTDEEVALNSTDIVLFVGGNNVGKSHTLSEIYNFLYDGNIVKQIILKDIEVAAINEENLKETIVANSVTKFENGINHYRSLGFGANEYNISKFQKGRIWVLRNFFASESKTSERLLVCKPCENITLEDTPTNYLQFIARNPSILTKLNYEFYNTFNTNVVCDFYTSNQIVLRLAKEIKHFETNILEAGNDLQKYFLPLPKVIDQGDGIKSFIAVLTNIMIDRYSMFFIDEPESFLHQPQSYAIAQSIANLGQGKQFFISTHSIQVLLGLLKVCPERLKIIKLNRKVNEDGKEVNPFTLLDNDHVSEIDKDPFMRYSNIFDGIFYKKVVIVESETDCKFYEYIYKTINNDNDYFFTLAHGKGKISKIISALSKLGLDSSIVFDIDVISNPEIIENVLISKGGVYSAISSDLLKVKHYIESLDETAISKDKLKESIVKIIESNDDTYLNDDTRKKCKKLFEPNSGWKKFKNNGISTIIDEDVLDSFKKVVTYLNSKGIFVVECGELEGFVPEFKSCHGTSWVEKVFEKYPDSNNPVFDNAKKFVSKL